MFESCLHLFLQSIHQIYFMFGKFGAFERKSPEGLSNDNRHGASA